MLQNKTIIDGFFGSEYEGHNWKNSKELLHKTSSTPDVLRTLISKGIFEEQSIREDRLLYDFKNKIKKKIIQSTAKSISRYLKTFEEKSVVLLQGVTGSGKQKFIWRLLPE